MKWKLKICQKRFKLFVIFLRPQKSLLCVSGVDKQFGVLLMDYGTHKNLENLWFSILSSKGPKNKFLCFYWYSVFSIISFWAKNIYAFWIKINFFYFFLCVAKKEREKFVCVHQDYRFALYAFVFILHFTLRNKFSLFSKLIFLQFTKHFLECRFFYFVF